MNFTDLIQALYPAADDLRDVIVILSGLMIIALSRSSKSLQAASIVNAKSWLADLLEWAKRQNGLAWFGAVLVGLASTGLLNR